jgi:cell division protein FtsZ
MSASAKIIVMGVGDGGTNAVDRILSEDLNGVELIAVNTADQTLMESRTQHRIRIGGTLTYGMGTAGNPDIGRRAAEESIVNLAEALRGAGTVFIVGGMGGGTGTGAAPVIARVAKKLGASTIGVVTRPLTVEGTQRQQVARMGIEMLKTQVDSLVVISSDHLLQYVPQNPAQQQVFGLMAGAVAWQVLSRLV